MNCGLPKPQTNCDAQLCYCSDKQVASAIWPGGDPTTCKGVENAAEDGWCVDNCKDALEKGSNSCPDYLCKCSKPGIKEKAPGTELPKGVKEKPLQFALPEGGDPSGCIALQGNFDPADPDEYVLVKDFNAAVKRADINMNSESLNEKLGDWGYKKQQKKISGRNQYVIHGMRLVVERPEY